MGKLYALFESAAGYALFKVLEHEEVAELLPAVQDSVTDYAKFSKVIKLASFLAFTSPEDALQNINDISEGILNDNLKNFLELNLPAKKDGKKSKVQLAVGHTSIATAISDVMGVSCLCNDTTLELYRGIRAHFESFLSASLKEGDLGKAQLGLGHSYSRAKVKFNVNRADNMIIQSISLLDQMDKDLNLFAMRLKEWYSWHFPELSKLVSDNLMFAKLVLAVKNKKDLTDADVPRLRDVTLDEQLAKSVVDAAKISMGADFSEVDMINVLTYSTRVADLAEFRHKLHMYLIEKMSNVAPNLAALIGELVGARLVAHAGSLTNLSKYPASTVQILGAEKALFRALKTRGNTPKYGLLYHSSFIGRAGTKDKGRIARYLANKCSMASRIDAFSDVTTDKYGEMLKSQVEERLKFYASGAAPRKNIDVMHAVSEELRNDMGEEEVKPTAMVVEAAAPAEEEKPAEKKKKEKKSKKREAPEAEEEAAPAPAPVVEELPKEEKKHKKSKKSEAVEAEPEPVAAVEPVVEEKKEKKHKKSKKSEAVEAEPEPVAAAEPVVEEKKEKKHKKSKKSDD